MGQVAGKGSDKKNARRAECEKIAQNTPFSLAEVQTLHNMFRQYSSDNKVIRKEDLSRALGGGRSSPFVNQVFKVLDLQGNNYIDFREFCVSLSVFSENANIDDKLNASFKFYDLDGSGSVSREELGRILVSTLEQEATDEQLKELVDQIFAQADLSRNNRITFNDYKAMVMRKPEFIQSLTLSSSSLADDFRRLMSTHSAADQWKNYLKLGAGGAGGSPDAAKNKRASLEVGANPLDAVMRSVVVRVNEKFVPQDSATTLPLAYQDPQPLHEFNYDFSLEKSIIASVSSGKG